MPQSSRNATELWQCDFSRSRHCCVSANILVLFCASLWIPLCNILVVVGVVWNYQFNSMVPVFSLGCSACSSHTHFEHYNEQLLACVLGLCLIIWIGKLIHTYTSTCKRMKDKWRNVQKKIWQKPDSRWCLCGQWCSQLRIFWDLLPFYIIFYGTYVYLHVYSFSSSDTVIFN